MGTLECAFFGLSGKTRRAHRNSVLAAGNKEQLRQAARKMCNRKRHDLTHEIPLVDRKFDETAKLKRRASGQLGIAGSGRLWNIGDQAQYFNLFMAACVASCH
ncbi:MAG: hypothetical protein KUL75_05630 [Sterolibacterium sp.]|nr:hypothetical protein [Sterolibacterium sp.]